MDDEGERERGAGGTDSGDPISAGQMETLKRVPSRRIISSADENYKQKIRDALKNKNEGEKKTGVRRETSLAARHCAIVFRGH